MKRAQGGFTLIEMMVVVVIIGILVGTITFGLAGRDREEKLRTEAERLALLIEMARSEAIQRNEEWGLAIGPADYRFLAFDATRQRWVEQKGQPFHARTVADMVLDRARRRDVDSRCTKAAQDVPSIIMFSSGEQTPFEVEITPAWKAQPLARCVGRARPHERTTARLNARGFTLIELLIAVTVFAVVAVTVYTRSGDALRQVGGLEERTLTTWIAENQLATLRLGRLNVDSPMPTG